MTVRKFFSAVVSVLLLVVVFGGLAGFGILPREEQPLLLIVTVGSMVLLVVLMVLLKEDPKAASKTEQDEKLKQLEKRLKNSTDASFMNWGVSLYRSVGYGWSAAIALGLMALPILSHFGWLPIDFTGIMAILGCMILIGVLAARKT